ncbi:MAG: EamA family transporter [Kofleriaceae bacterium]
MLTYALVLTSAFLHAGWNALVKRTRDPGAAVHAVVATAGGLTALIATVEWAAGGRGASPRALAMAGVAGALEAGYFHALGRALTLGPLGPVYAISRGGAALLVWPLSMLLLGERMTALGAAGSALIIIGLAGAGATGAAPARAVRYAATCAGFIAGYNITYKYALMTGTSPILVFAVSMVVATGLGAAFGGASYRRAFAATLRAQPWSTLGAGVVCAAGFLLFMFGLARGGAAYVFTLRNTSVLFAAGLGLALGERPPRRALAAVGLIFLGAVGLGLAR